MKKPSKRINQKNDKYVGDMTTDKTMSARAGIQYADQSEFFKWASLIKWLL